jgi:hypothetical protein
MRLKLLTLFLFLTGTVTFAQTQFKSFSQDTGVYIKELGEFMNEDKSDEGEKTYNLFLVEWKRTILTDDQRRFIVRLSNKMLMQKLRANPDFVSFLKALTAFSKQNKGEAIFINWQKIADKTVADNKKAFKEFMDFSAGLFEDNIIFKSNSKTWQCTSPQYELKFDAEPYIVFKNTDLKCFANGNNTTIYNTSGSYYPNKRSWIGTGGKMGYTRVGLDMDNVWVDINNYTINTDKYEFTIDSVFLTNKQYKQYKVAGVITEKLISISEPANQSYPKFKSYNNDIFIDDFGKGIHYKGGFGMYGKQVAGIGTTAKRAAFTFFYKDSLRCKIESVEFFISDEMISAEDTKFRILVKNDSLFHPKMRVTFNRKDRVLVLYRGKEGVESGPLYDSYHRIEMYVDEVLWRIDGPIVEFKMTTKDQSARFESLSFYKDQRYEAMQGALDYNPLTKVAQMCRARKSPDFTLQEFADFMGSKEEYVLPFVLLMADKGFCDYDIDNKKVHVYNKVYDYVNAHNGVADYDIIKFESIIAAHPNASMNLVNFDLKVEGVPRLQLSDSQNVYVILKEQTLNIKKNREMEFDGRVHAGRFDFFGKGFDFDYQNFNIHLSNVDSMKFFFPAKEKDEYGRDQMVRINSVLENIYGTLYIDHPNNKSSRVNYPEYPIFTSDKGSNVFYDYPTTQGGSYTRSRFYFKVDPFTIDSLDNFTKEGLFFEGEFMSDGIVPNFRHKLSLQDDYSLGFLLHTPAGGYPLYKGKGRGDFEMSLSNLGFFGNGSIDYLTTHLTSNKFLFLLDSMNTIADDVVTTKSALFPSATTHGAYVEWRAYRDTMSIFQQKEPFLMYDKALTMVGSLIITPKGMGGSGTTSFDDADISSKVFQFANHTFSSNVASFKLKTVDPTKFAFSATNVKAFVDMDKRYADFKSNVMGSKVDLPYNQYRSSLSDMTWKIDEKKIILNAGAKQSPQSAVFISTLHEQDSLNFISTNAIFDLKTYILTCYKVPYIYVADSKIFPDSNMVVINKDALMNTLDKCLMKADTVNAYHELYNCSINILGRQSMRGTGFYNFTDRMKVKKVIYFSEINVNTEKQMTAKSVISDTNAFVLSKHFDFKGDALLTSVKRDLTFNGYVLPLHEAPPASVWFRFDDAVNKDSVLLKIDDPIDADKNPLSIGFNVANDSVGLYTSFFSRRHSYSDDMILLARSGKMYYDETTEEFKVGDAKKLRKKSYQGSMVTFNDAKRTITGEGKINFNANAPKFNIKAAGIITNKIDSSYTLDLVAIFDFLLPAEAQKIMADTVFSTSRELPDIASDRYVMKAGLGELADEKNYDAVINKLEKDGKVNLVDEFEKTLLITDLKMTWKPQNRAFVGIGGIGINSIGNKVIQKRLFGKIQITKKRSGDQIGIYFETNSDTWYYFNFRGKTLSVLSNDENFNKAIKDNIAKMSDDTYRLQIATLRDKTIFLKFLEY